MKKMDEHPDKEQSAHRSDPDPKGQERDRFAGLDEVGFDFRLGKPDFLPDEVPEIVDDPADQAC